MKPQLTIIRQGERTLYVGANLNEFLMSLTRDLIVRKNYEKLQEVKI